MAAEAAGGWHEEAGKLCNCGEDDLMAAAVGDRSIFSLDDINLDDIFLDLNDTDIPGFGPDHPSQTNIFSSANLHGSASETASTGVDAPAAGCVLADGLPCDDIDVTQLEWLSNFCDESYSLDSPAFVPCNTGNVAFHVPGDDGDDNKMGANVVAGTGAAKDELTFRTSSPISVLEHSGLTVGISPLTSFSTTATSSSTSSLSSPTSSSCSGVGDVKMMPPEPVLIPARSRSKRPRPASFSPRPPIVIPLPPSSEAASLSSTSTAPLVSEEHDNFELVSHSNQRENADSAAPNNKTKKKKKKAPPPAPTADGEQAAVSSPEMPPVRKCMHCEVTKTPQWRAGPMGPKTLCNACGVRYKSGRLFPEYRPAASPTFVESLHSNSHKKVVEMRNKTTEGVTAAPKPGALRHDVASKACELLEYIRRREWCGNDHHHSS